MQDRYAGDVGDFGKYGLLRALCGRHDRPSLRLGVVWYLVPDETHNDDGKHIRYVQTDKRGLRDCDHELYDGLRDLFVDNSGQVMQARRRVAAIEGSRLLPWNTIFYSERLVYRKEMPGAERLSTRREWFKQALKKTASAHLVFLDPDNGIECESVSLTALKAPKYVFWDEIRSFANRGQSVVVIHHCGHHCSSKEQVSRLLKCFHGQMPQRFETSALIYKRGTRRFFFVAIAPEHREILSTRRARMLSYPWEKHFGDGGTH